LLLTLLVTPVAYSLLTARRRAPLSRTPGSVAPESGAALLGAGH